MSHRGEEGALPRLSIIIPAYNVERFLDRCLESVVQQTYQDFEVVLINDGSTDSTLRLCREWVARDSRIRLISQENKGLAETRNVGVRASVGSLLMFVDSDDYLEARAAEVLVALQEETGADIAMGRFVSEDLSGREDKRYVQLGNRTLTRKEAYIKVLFDREVKSFAWGKVYRRTLFDGNEYPSGKLLEDYMTTYLLFFKADRVVSTREVVYHYVQRPDSIMHERLYSAVRDIAFMEAVYARFIHARSSGLLSRRELALFRVKTERRLLRTYFTIARLGDSVSSQESLRSVCRYLCDVTSCDIRRSDLGRLWRWSRCRKVWCWLFLWG